MIPDMSTHESAAARSFGSVAKAYDQGRPDYPAKAVAWLMGADARTVLELGAGTGKLTQHLVEQGHDVHATDPDPEMLRVLQERCPGVRTSIATAEAIPVPDRSVDVVVAAQSFHWFDHEVALPEIARVLKPGGHLALVWNKTDERIPWVRRFTRILGDPGHDQSNDAVVQSEYFGFVEEEKFNFWHVIDRVSVRDLARSKSHIAALPEDKLKAKLDEVSAFYAEFGRGMDGMQLPYQAHCFRSKVSAHRPTKRPAAADAASGTGQSGTGQSGTAENDEVTPPPADGDTGEFLLIDFR